jgi:hypothetical protein
MKEPLIRTLVKKALKEAELSVGSDNTKFGIKLLVSNPQSETKQGIRIQLKPKEGFLEPEKKGELSSAIMQKFNDSLKQFNLQISLDTDTSDPEAMGFFIPLPQLKNMIVTAIGGKTTDDNEPSSNISSRPPSRPTEPKPPTDIPDNEDEELNEDDALDRAAKLAKQPLPGYMSDMTGLGLKRKGYEDEQGGELTLQELYDKLGTAYELLVDVFKDIYGSDYKFKTYYENNEDEITRTMGAIAMMKDDVEDRLELEEPVGPDQGIEEGKLIESFKSILKEQSTFIPRSNHFDKLNLEAIKFEKDNPEEYKELFDKYVSQGGEPQNRFSWLSFWARLAWPKGLNLWGPGDYGVAEEKNPLNEMRVRDLNQISKVVLPEDFYGFVNMGNNILRTLDQQGIPDGKKYLAYLVKHNIM